METRLASPCKALWCHHQASKMMGQSGKAAGPAGSTLGKAAAQGSTRVRGQPLPCPVLCSPPCRIPPLNPALAFVAALSWATSLTPAPLNYCLSPIWSHSSTLPEEIVALPSSILLPDHPPPALQSLCCSQPFLSATQPFPHHPFSLCFPSLSVFPGLECCETN